MSVGSRQQTPNNYNPALDARWRLKGAGMAGEAGMESVVYNCRPNSYVRQLGFRIPNCEFVPLNKNKPQNENIHFHRCKDVARLNDCKPFYWIWLLYTVHCTLYKMISWICDFCPMNCEFYLVASLPPILSSMSEMMMYNVQLFTKLNRLLNLLFSFHFLI